MQTFSKFGEAAVTLNKFFRDRNVAPPALKPLPGKGFGQVLSEGGGERFFNGGAATG